MAPSSISPRTTTHGSRRLLRGARVASPPSPHPPRPLAQFEPDPARRVAPFVARFALARGPTGSKSARTSRPDPEFCAPARRRRRSRTGPLRAAHRGRPSPAVARRYRFSARARLRQPRHGRRTHTLASRAGFRAKIRARRREGLAGAWAGANRPAGLGGGARSPSLRGGGLLGPIKCFALVDYPTVLPANVSNAGYAVKVRVTSTELLHALRVVGRKGKRNRGCSRDPSPLGSWRRRRL